VQLPEGTDEIHVDLRVDSSSTESLLLYAPGAGGILGNNTGLEFTVRDVQTLMADFADRGIEVYVEGTMGFVGTSSEEITGYCETTGFEKPVGDSVITCPESCAANGFFAWPVTSTSDFVPYGWNANSSLCVAVWHEYGSQFLEGQYTVRVAEDKTFGVIGFGGDPVQFSFEYDCIL